MKKLSDAAREKSRIASKAWRIKNPEKVLANNNARPKSTRAKLVGTWYSRNKERAKANGIKYRATHEAAIRAQQAIWLANNKDKQRGYSKHTRAKHGLVMNAATKTWKLDNPEKAKAGYDKWRLLNLEKIKIDAKKYLETRLEIRAGRPRPKKCEVCTGTYKISFEHCHRTNTFRGWICHNCNIALGFAKDNPKTLRKLAGYLEAHIVLVKNKLAPRLISSVMPHQNKLELIAGRKRPKHCEVCSSSKCISFEHCHRTNTFRGWTCHCCNMVLNYVNDTPEILRKLADYLEAHIDSLKTQEPNRTKKGKQIDGTKEANTAEV